MSNNGALLNPLQISSTVREALALTLLKKATALRDDIRIVHLDMGVIFTEQNHYQEALAALQRARKLDPEQPEVHYRLGRLYQAMGDGEAAKAEFAMVQSLHQKAEDDIADKMSGQETARRP